MLPDRRTSQCPTRGDTAFQSHPPPNPRTSRAYTVRSTRVGSQPLGNVTAAIRLPRRELDVGRLFQYASPSGGLVSQRNRGRNDPPVTGRVVRPLGGSAATLSPSGMLRPSNRPERGTSGVDPRRSRYTAALRGSTSVETSATARAIPDGPALSCRSVAADHRRRRAQR